MFVIKVSTLLVCLCSYSAGICQSKDSTKLKEPLKGTAIVQFTNNGVSLFPNFSLGKPAIIANATVGKNRFFFEPEMRWSLTGKPWSYIFWLRYRPKKIAEHFGFHIGAHPSYVFREENVNINKISEKRFTAQRYFASEIMPVWYVSDKFHLAVHYLHGRGLDSYAAQQSNFISLQPRFPKIDLHKKYYLSFYPQLFYLIIDDTKGSYLSESLNLNKQQFPFSLTTMMTYKLQSTIPGDDFVWSVGLNIKF